MIILSKWKLFPKCTKIYRRPPTPKRIRPGTLCGRENEIDKHRISTRRSIGQSGVVLTCRICVPWCCSNKSNAKPAAVRLDEAPGKRRREGMGIRRTIQLKRRGKSAPVTPGTGHWINIIIRKGLRAHRFIHYGLWLILWLQKEWVGGYIYIYIDWHQPWNPIAEVDCYLLAI